MVEQADKNKELYNDINTALQQEKEQKPISDEQKEAIIQTLYPNNDFQSFTSNYFSVMQFYTSKIRSP